MNTKHKFVAVGKKISRSHYAQLQRMAKLRGMSLYDLIRSTKVLEKF